MNKNFQKVVIKWNFSSLDILTLFRREIGMSSNAVQTKVEVAREIELGTKGEQIDLSVLLPE